MEANGEGNVKNIFKTLRSYDYNRKQHKTTNLTAALLG